MRPGRRGGGVERDRDSRGLDAGGVAVDIYLQPCVTGSAKSAMMNVLAGINPQCTPSPNFPPCTPDRHLSAPSPGRPVSILAKSVCEQHTRTRTQILRHTIYVCARLLPLLHDEVVQRTHAHAYRPFVFLLLSFCFLLSADLGSFSSSCVCTLAYFALCRADVHPSTARVYLYPYVEQVDVH